MRNIISVYPLLRQINGVFATNSNGQKPHSQIFKFKIKYLTFFTLDEGGNSYQGTVTFSHSLEFISQSPKEKKP